MVISDKHRYVYVELPFTGSSAVRKELREYYGGRAILSKHSTYREFLKFASPEQKRYFVFSGIRNPLDEVVSIYTKLKTDHKQQYSKREWWISRRDLRRFNWVQTRDASFASFFLRFYRLPFENWSSLDHHRFDFVYRLESIQEGFAEALRGIGLEPVHPLPVVHKTQGKKSWESYYTPDTYERARFVFGPMMQRWGYEFPPSWRIAKVQWYGRLAYRSLAGAKNTARRMRFIRHRAERRPA